MTTEENERLPSGSELDEYRIESVLGQGGFGITYLARDTSLEQPVAIKEYLPRELAIRGADRHVEPRSAELEPTFRHFRDRFLAEAQTLAKLLHPNIVRVRRYFERLGTAYMVMDYEEGRSLKQVLETAQTPPEEAWIRSLLVPLLDALEAVHAARFLHRDIKPANILVRSSGTPLLLDFGSARSVQAAPGGMTALYTPRYGAYEQYAGERKEGPWTDIRGMAAVLYHLVAGEPPLDDRLRYEEPIEGKPPHPRDPDPFVRATAIGAGRYEAHLLEAIDWGLRLDESSRPQSVAEWRRGRGSDAGLHAILSSGTTTTVTGAGHLRPTTLPGRGRARAIAAIGGGLLVALMAVLSLPPAGRWMRKDEVASPLAPHPPAESEVASEPASPKPLSDSTIGALGIVDGSDTRYRDDPDLLLADLRADARRQAIEKAVGIFVPRDALKRQYATLEDAVFSHTELIDRLVDDARPHPSGHGFVYLSTLAEVRLQDLRKLVHRLSREQRIALIRAQGNPLISVSVSIRDADRGSPIERSALAENVIKERIRDFGFRVASSRGEAAGDPRAPSSPLADFAVESEAKLKRLEHTLAASGITIEKYVLTSWTVKCADRATGEDIYFDNRLPDSGSWPDEDRALQEIGTLIADSFSRDFFAEHLPRTSRKSRLDVHDVPSSEAAKLLRLALLGVRPVSQVATPEIRGATASYALSWYDQGPGGEQSFDGNVLAPLRRRLGRDCLPVESDLGGDDITVRLATACVPDLIARLEELPSAALNEAPAERLAAARRPAAMLALPVRERAGARVVAARSFPISSDSPISKAREGEVSS